MTRRKEKTKAIKLRKQGKSYSEIKKRIGVSKSTLSGWLQDYPLSKEDLIRLRDKNPKRIERFRATMQKKRDTRIQRVKQLVKNDIKKVSRDAYFLAGFYLYWGEGGKTKPYSVSMSNTDPSVLQFFISWLELLGWDKNNVSVRLQLYSDMNIENEIKYWKETLQLPTKCFKKPYIKKAKRKDITYTSKHVHGTCNVIVDNRDLSEYILQGIKVIQEQYINPKKLPVSKRSVGYTRARV